jgi:hypothetical protein
MKVWLSRSQTGRLLAPKDGNVTPAVLQRAERMVGRLLRLNRFARKAERVAVTHAAGEGMIRKSVQRLSLATNARCVCAEIMLEQ